MSGSPRLIGLPYDASSSFLQGAAEAPPLIRAALHSPAWNSWAHGLRDVLGPGGLTDAGDLTLPPRPDARALIEDGIVEVIAGGSRPIALGGDHSVTYPAVRAVAQSYAPLTILHIDAHPDLYEVFEGDRYSHACPFARIMEEGLAVRLVQVGIRTMNRHQREQADRFGVEVIDMPAWLEGTRPHQRQGLPLDRPGWARSGLCAGGEPPRAGWVVDPRGAGTGAGAGGQSGRGGRRRVQPRPRRRRRHGHGGCEDREGNRGADDGGGRLTSASRLTA
jgi:hypothetical protein